MYRNENISARTKSRLVQIPVERYTYSEINGIVIPI